jgi:pimeloyl-ACP methyl ester carboxylesterase
MFSAQRFKDLSRSTSPEVLTRIDVPTLVIHGKEDRIINYKSSEIFKDYIPIVVTKIYPETGHLPMYEVPERVAKDITDFFSEHLPQRSVLLNKY